MLSRVADALYWMNRYVERAENYARFLDVNFNLSLEMPPGGTEQWKPVIVTTGDYNLYESTHDNVDKTSVIHFLGFDENNPNSIYNSICNARENARAIRPDITREVWEQINSLYYHVREGVNKKQWEKHDPRNYFLEVKKSCQLLYGIFDSTISRTEGYHFGKIGQLIERADKTSRVLDVKYHMLLPSVEEVGSPLDLVQWASLLKSVSAYDMYRKKRGKLSPLFISEFLIFDKEFPRSMMNCLEEAEESLQAITGSSQGYANMAEKRLGRLKSNLEYADIEEVFNVGLHEYLDNFQLELNEVSNAIYLTFFSWDNFSNQTQTTNQ
ncbi:alpha-E domain-containing protein [Ekhidna sp.]|uniref:alpha-E domain-containing protein n=1 Tax=Ekhidna sp. TaxID=2608089 RepID=UPI003B507A56